MREPNKNYVYDLSELKIEELDEIANYMHNNHGWKDQVPHTDLFWHEVSGTWLYNKHEKVNNMVNAKELFYTLENIQVDCRELSEDQIKEMADVFEKAGYKIWDDPDAFEIKDNFVYLTIDWVNEYYITGESDTKTTITYDKFMELFNNKEENFKKLVEVLNEELTEKAYEVSYIAEKPKQYQIGIDTFERCEANMTKEEILACVRFNIDKYNFRVKGQDLEDLEKIIAYANWGIKQLKQR